MTKDDAITPTAPVADATGAPPPSRGRTRARVLRNNATDAERKLWFELREFKKYGHYFRRQVPIGKYVVDFACLKSKLIIELDGEHHASGKQRQHDIKRDKWLESEGYQVIRFWNADVYKHKNSVLDTIYSALPLEGGGGQTLAKGLDGGGDAPQEGKPS